MSFEWGRKREFLQIDLRSNHWFLVLLVRNINRLSRLQMLMKLCKEDEMIFRFPDALVFFFVRGVTAHERRTAR